MFLSILLEHDFDSIKRQILAFTKQDVATVIEKSTAGRSLTVDDFACLLSPAATEYLEQMAMLSRQRTQRRFGRTIQLYIPLYISNYCSNNCVYCGFNAKNNIKRIALSSTEILQEAQAIKAMGYEHVLLVTGENNKEAGVDYLENAIEIVKPMFSSISAEIQPLQAADYKQLITAGLSSVYIYQETYNMQKYRFYHPVGKKSDFGYRLTTPERLGETGIYRIGLGALLGLEDWHAEAYCLALHLRFLQKHYWKTKYSISFPRIRPSQGGFQPNCIVTDEDLTQLICAFRLFDEDVEIALSTRESQSFRNNIMTLGITSMSAGSKTEPGGYAVRVNELAQFQIDDKREPTDLVAEIKKQDYTAIWKDWDNYLGKF